MGPCAEDSRIMSTGAAKCHEHQVCVPGELQVQALFNCVYWCAFVRGRAAGTSRRGIRGLAPWFCRASPLLTDRWWLMEGVPSVPGVCGIRGCLQRVGDVQFVGAAVALPPFAAVSPAKRRGMSKRSRAPTPPPTRCTTRLFLQRMRRRGILQLASGVVVIHGPPERPPKEAEVIIHEDDEEATDIQLPDWFSDSEPDFGFGINGASTGTDADEATWAPGDNGGDGRAGGNTSAGRRCRRSHIGQSGEHLGGVQPWERPREHMRTR